MKKFLSLAFLIAILASSYVYFFVYNKSHIDYTAEKPEYVLTAKKLYFNFVNGDSSSIYLGKVVAISGEINAVENTDSTTVVSFNFEEGMFGNQGVRCSMNEIDSTLHSGEKINLKGRCTGFNDTDVILEYCSIIK